MLGSSRITAGKEPRMEFPRLDKNVLEITSFDDQDRAEVRYWHAQTPQTRIGALEGLRRLNFGEEAATARLQRVLEVTQRK